MAHHNTIYNHIHKYMLHVFVPPRSSQVHDMISPLIPSTIHTRGSHSPTADSTSCTGLERKGLTPRARIAISNPPPQHISGSQPMVHPAHWPTAQCKQSEKGSHALSARTAPRVLRGSYLQ